ncbi:MAG: ATP-binding protein [Bacteroidota bacterium]|jgi:hypothetical protein|nr:ATP-binding protein [Bacteroidota bacterium]
MTMTKDLFEQLLSTNESWLLDFKREHYKLIGGTEDDLAKMVKDIISLSNTIRERTAYIILGIEEEGVKKHLHGINEPIDDNILQAKIKDKVSPRPHFLYCNFEYLDKVFGIIEIPIRKHAEPIMPVVKMKGLEVGKIYFRRGSTNDEATGREAIQINTWITNLPDIIEKSEVKTKIVDLIAKINMQTTPLSVLLTGGITIGNVSGYESIGDFCKNEIRGYYGAYTSDDPTISHRKTKAFISPFQVTNVHGTINEFWTEMKNHDGFSEQTIFMNESITIIETSINEFKERGMNSFSSKMKPASEFPRLAKHYESIYIYTGYENFNGVYVGTRQKYLELLMDKL